MTKGFRSKAPKISAPGSFEIRPGSYLARLEHVNLYWSDRFQSEEKDLCMSFVFAVEDTDSLEEPHENLGDRYQHVESFVRLQVDDEGNFGPGGSRAKANKILAAFIGKDIDPKADDYEFALYGPDLEQYDSIFDIPHWKHYAKGDEWLALTEVSVSGINAVGREAMIQFGNADKPDGGKSDKVSIINAMALPGQRPKGRKGGMKSAQKPNGSDGGDVRNQPGGDVLTPEPEPAPKRPDPINPDDYQGGTRWVLKALEKMEIPNMQWLGFLRYFAENPKMTLDTFETEDARTFKGLYESDAEGLMTMYKDWAQESSPFKDEPVADQADDVAEDEFAEFPEELPV